ncbi:PLP-dependent aminotransferase family protein [Escherichia coli]|nr:PLP-dependent aminotransferase family protein [Escherichia coli]
MEILPVPVDDNGLDITSGIQNYPDARFALITPAHQSPLGVALSLARRHQILEWADRSQAWIIEDDYDSEFRYHGKPLPALKSLDAPQRVIYAGTFSKALFPALRCAWLVVPVKQIAQFRHQASLAPCAVPVLWQNTLADFLREGHFWRHLKKMRQHYAQRRQWIEQALTQQGFQVVPQKGGIQMVIRMIGDDIAHARKANAAGLAVQALSDWRIRSSGEGGLLLSFTNIVNEGMARQVAQQLRKALI